MTLRLPVETRPLVVLAGLYVAQTIPIFFVGTALPPILRAAGIGLETIGALGLLILPWALKFLWAPLVDRRGSRRAWILGSQLAALLALIAISRLDPGRDVGLLFLLLFVVSVASATQDVATDGWAVEHLPPARQAAGGAVQAGAGAGGVLLGGTAPLALHDMAGWGAAVAAAAALAALAAAPAGLAREREGRREGVPERRRPAFSAFLRRPEALAVLLFAVLLRAPDGLVKAIEPAFLIDAGFSPAAIGLISGAGGAALGLAGAAATAVALRRVGLSAVLWSVVLLRTAVLGLFAVAASLGLPHSMLAACAVALGLTRYIEAAALYAVFLRTASLAQAGLDFTILSSAAALTFALGSVVGGALGSAAGYGPLFTGATALSLGAGASAIYLLKKAGGAERLAACRRFATAS